MIYLTTIPFAIVAIFLFIYFKRNKISVVNPSNIATIGWFFPFMLTPLLKLSPYYETWSPGPSLVFWIIIAFLSFIFGNFIGYSTIKPKSVDYHRSIEHKKSSFSIARFRKQAYIVFLFGMIGYINNVINIINAGGLSVYTELGFREAELTFGSNTLINYLYFLNILTILMFVYLRYIQHENRSGDWMIIAISCIALFSHGVKGTIVWPLVMVFILIHINRKTIIWSIVLPAIICILGIFLIVTLGRELPTLVAGTSDLNEWFVKGLLNFPLYFSTGFVNLEIELEKFTNFAFGLNTIAPFYEVVSFFFGNRQPLEITAATDDLLYFHAYNTATYLRDPLRDFGIIGIILFPLLYGLITSILFSCSSQSINPYIAISYSIYAAAIFGMFFSNHFQKIQYIFLILICFTLASLNKRNFR